MQTRLRTGLVWSTLANFGGRSISAALQLLMVGVLIRSLGTESYGVLVLGLGLVGGSNLLEGAFGQAVTRQIAHYDARSDRRAVAEIVALHLLSTLGQITFFGLTFLIIEQFWLEAIFAIPDGLEATAHLVVRLCIAIMIFDLLSMFLLRVAEGFQNFVGVRLLEVGKQIVRFVAVLTVLGAGGGVVHVGAAHLAASVAMVIASSAYLGRCGYLRLAWPRGWRRPVEVGRFSLPILLHKIVAFLGNRADVFIIGHFLGTTALALYQVAFKFYEIFGQFVSTLTVATMPYAAQLGARGDAEAVGRLFMLSVRYVIRLVGPVVLTVAAFTTPLIEAWAGAAGREAAAAAQLYLACILLLALPGAAAPIMLGLGRWRQLLIWQLLGSMVSIALSLLLVPRLHVSGAALGSLVGAATIGVSYWIVTARALVSDFRAVRLVFLANHLLPALVVMAAANIADRSGSFARVVMLAPIAVLSGWWWAGREPRRWLRELLRGSRWRQVPRRVFHEVMVGGGTEKE